MTATNTGPVIIVAPTCFGLVLSKTNLVKASRLDQNSYLYQLHIEHKFSRHKRDNKMNGEKIYYQVSHQPISRQDAVDHFRCSKVAQGWSIPCQGIKPDGITNLLINVVRKLETPERKPSSLFPICYKSLRKAFDLKVKTILH